MRVTSSIMTDRISRTLRQQMEDILKLTDDVTSQKKIHKPSDDPFNTGRIMDLDKSIIDNKQWQENITDGKSWLGNADEIISQMQDTLQLAYSKGVQGDNDAMSEEEKESLSILVNQHLEHLYNLSNKQFGGKYIFNGDATNAQPYVAYRVDGEIQGVAQFAGFENGNPNDALYVYYEENGAGQYDGIYLNKDGEVVRTVTNDSTYGTNSINGEMNRRIGEDTYVNVAINGGAILQPNGASTDTDAFNTLIALRDGLANNDTDQIGSQIEKLLNQMDTVTSIQGTNGAIYNRLEVANEIISAEEITVKDALSKIEDTDISEAMMEYSRLESAFNVSLQMGANLLRTNLSNYL